MIHHLFIRLLYILKVWRRIPEMKSFWIKFFLPDVGMYNLLGVFVMNKTVKEMSIITIHLNRPGALKI